MTRQIIHTFAPQKAEFYINRGGAWLLKGQPDRAIDDLNHALELAPELADAWSHRGAAWFARQDYTRAIADFDKALKLNPRMADAYCKRGVAQLKQGRLAEVEADFARCRESGGKGGPITSPDQCAATSLRISGRNATGRTRAAL